MIVFKTTVNHNYQDKQPTPSLKKKNRNEKGKNPLKPHASWLSERAFFFNFLRRRSTKIFENNLKHNR